METVTRGGMIVAVALAAGCVYAPRAQEVALVKIIHTQTATNMVITETTPVEPRIANELTGAVGAQIKGNQVASGNQIASPRVK